MGTVNCYLITTGQTFFLIDTGPANEREKLESSLGDAGCTAGRLALIVLTHGDFDHTGNCAYLRDKFGSPVAMHRDDAGMIERGDMFWNRKSGNVVIRALAPVMFRFPKSSRLAPDDYLEDGQNLAEYGLDAQVIHLRGHSSGSIGVLTASGDLFCGDLFENVDQPGLGSLIDDGVAATASVEKLRGLAIGTVYPGHGKPFQMAEFVEPVR
jgi:glyoxylase-like metal-dependent hydrolase (beta-lactamase superfamily II)